MLIRPFHPTDLPPVLSLLSTSLPIDPISESRFTRQVLLDHNFRPEGAPVAVVNDQVVGFALSIARQTPLENATPDADRGYITLFAVHPDHRRQGIGTALLNHCESYLRAQSRKIIMLSSYAPNYFIPGVDIHHYQPAHAFFLARGFKDLLRPLAMSAPLWSFETPAWVHEKRRAAEAAGLRFDTYRPELTLPLLDFLKKEFPGDWVRVARAAADRILQGDSPARLHICHDGSGGVLGFSHYELERFGPIGTAPAARGRGLGQVLMYLTLHAQRAAGLRAAWFLWSDDKTAARLYSPAGFTESRRFALLKKEI
jgi:GNAT superfamily N-acetyltransferase